MKFIAELLYQFRYQFMGIAILIVAIVTLLLVFGALLFPSCQEQIAKYEALKKEGQLVPRFVVVKSNCEK